MQLEDLHELARHNDEEVETPWRYDGTPLMMYRAGVNTNQGGGVSWSFILRNASLTLLIRKMPLGSIMAQARLGSECLWRLTPRRALDELDTLMRRMWRGSLRHPRKQQGKWQVSQVHLAHDVAHAPLEQEQLERYVSQSRKQSVFEAARADLTALYRGLDAAHPVDTFLDTGFDGGLDWDTLYAGDVDDLIDLLDPFGEDNKRTDKNHEPVPAEDRAVMLHWFGRRVSGVTWSPGAAVSFVTYDKVLEGRLCGKSHMEPIWRANGWDEKAPVTRHEARLRREALRAFGVPEANVAEFDDPWQMLERL